MIWTIDQQPENGIMFRGQSTVQVRNRRGDVGEATVEYYPSVRVAGPVVEVVEVDPEGYPVREAEVIDRRPTFKS